MTVFRWFNSAIALSVISTFIETISVEDGNEYLQQSLMYKVYPVIVAELFCNPVIEILDVPENFRKHVLAPRTKDQAEMNACFTGGRFWLAERYTNANRVLFVALFFAAILPEALFLGSMALLAQYAVGKFSLLRLCGPTPDVGFHLARLSRNYFIPTVLITHVVMSAYWWSGYPYDSICENNNDNGEGGYSYCNQNMYGSNIFPPLPRFQPEDAKWMTESQATLTSLYGWTSVVVLLIAAYTFLRYKVIPWIRSLYESTYVPDGMDQGIDFTKVTHLDEVHGYIPQVRRLGNKIRRNWFTPSPPCTHPIPFSGFCTFPRIGEGVLVSLDSMRYPRHRRRSHWVEGQRTRLRAAQSRPRCTDHHRKQRGASRLFHCATVEPQ